MFVNSQLCKTLLLLLLAFGLFDGRANSAVFGPYRGMNTQIDITEQDVIDFAALGGNILRISCQKRPLQKKEAPYEFDLDAFNKLDQILSWCEKYKVKVIIDPHTFPGTQIKSTTVASDLIWTDYKWHRYVIDLWDFIAARYKGRGDVVVGYDIINEPTVPAGFPDSGPGSINELYGKIVNTIRMHDLNKYIIIEPPAGNNNFGQHVNRVDGIKHLKVPEDNRIIVSPHIYVPASFTHQGVGKVRGGGHYPGLIAKQYWDKNKLREALYPIRAFQIEHGVPIFVGEFSAVRWSGDDGNRYVSDLIEIFEEYGWSWAYHSFRQAHEWDAEIGTFDKDDRKRVKSTPRLEILKNAFKKNNI